LRWLVSDYYCFCSTLNKFLQRFLFLFLFFCGRGYKLVFPPHTQCPPITQAFFCIENK
jgi:hypothetical protein